MGKKAIDFRIPTLIRNNVQEKQRSLFIIVGDKARNQLPNLHYLMMSSDLKMNKSILWAYKKSLLGFTSHRKKREKKIKQEVKKGIREVNDKDPFEAFVTNQHIRYVYYKETEKILGNTYGMCILQDFEALTPNLLARTIETVEGGGIIVLLLKSMNSLKQLYTMNMDIHSRYRTEAHDDVVARFNERFLLSLNSNPNCLVVDDELNVLPISGGKDIERLAPADEDDLTKEQKELADLKQNLEDVQPAGSLVALAKTINQAQAVLTFIDSITEKSLRDTVALTAGRGRGKSAALGISIAAAVSTGYSNIFVTSPSPENLKTLFEFIFKGFDALNYVEHVDYDIIQSSNPSFNKAVVRVDIKRSHRQTIQYILPTDHQVLGQAELLIIDEAAAIPLPFVKKLLGPYLTFMASTINGYEGTGRSLSLKLIQQLREQSVSNNSNIAKDTEIVSRDHKSINVIQGRSLKEVVLSEPIRYAPGDKIEKWLNKLLCLDATISKNTTFATKGTPHPSKCELYYVNRDTLFSYHPVSETFLQKIMALYVSSHYKNSPNDLQLMSDSPSQQIFVLLPPVEDNKIPDPLCVIQLALEGEISRESVRNSLGRGVRAGGDLIPWVISQQFQDEEFAGLSGGRVVRIATNPDYSGMGYGSKALELLKDYYEGKFTNLSEDGDGMKDYRISRISDKDLSKESLRTEQIKLRELKTLPPLLLKLHQIPPYFVHYLGVSYGLTNQLHKFWKRQDYIPVYLRQTANELTGEHTCVMIHVLKERNDKWLKEFAKDFHSRFLSLLGYNFNLFKAIQCLNILESLNKDDERKSTISKTELDYHFTPFDLKRLESYSNNLLDYHVITDLLPKLAMLFFKNKLDANLSSVQCAILLSVGLQFKDIEVIANELNLPVSQCIAMFAKVVKKISNNFSEIVTESIESDMPELTNGSKLPDEDSAGEEEMIEKLENDMNDELELEGKKVYSKMNERQKELIDSIDLKKYEIDENTVEWNENDAKKASKKGNSGVLGLKQKDKKRKGDGNASEILQQEMKHAFKKGKKAKRH